VQAVTITKTGAEMGGEPTSTGMMVELNQYATRSTLQRDCFIRTTSCKAVWSN